MSPRKYRLHDGKHGSAITVRVTPRASRNEIVEIQENGTIKIHLTAASVDGDANTALAKFLSEILGVPQTRVEIIVGTNSHDKIVSVLDMDTETLHKRIVAHVD